MSHIVADRIKEATTTTGTGPLALGGALTGFGAFSSVCSIGDTVHYAIEAVGSNNALTGAWEVGLGTYSAANTLTRTTILASSNNGNPVDFGAGTKHVWIDVPADVVKSPRIPNAAAVKWYDTAGTLLDAIKLDASNVFNVGLQGAAASGGHLAWWANGVEKARLLASGALLVGATAAVGAELTLASITGFTPVSGAVIASRASGSAASTATGSIRGYQSEVTTAAAAFTATELTHFSAAGAALGAGSSVTSAYGFQAKNALAVGANNYAFWTDFSAASNKYAIYAAGTAESLFNGPIGINTNPASGQAAWLYVGGGSNHYSSSASPVGAKIDFISPATATSSSYGMLITMRSASASFTATSFRFFSAEQVVVGASSAITSVYGFMARNTIAVGTANFGFYSDINSAASTYQFYAAGSATSYFGGPIGVQVLVTQAASAFRVAISSAQSNATIQAVQIDGTVPSTAVNAWYGVNVLPATANATFTTTNMVGFTASSITKGAAHTITRAIGFWAQNGFFSSATDKWGFYSDVVEASGAYQLYMAGSAKSYLGGYLSLLSNSPGAAVVRVGAAHTHSSTAATVYTFYGNMLAPSTATVAFVGYDSNLGTVAQSFTLANLSHFVASTVSKGAGSTITTVIGFQANNNIAVGANNFGFYSGLNSAANTYQFYAAGTALNLFKGGVILDTTAAPTVGAGQIGFGATTATTVGAAGAASALPANPLGYLVINVAGTSAKVPYYNA